LSSSDLTPDVRWPTLVNYMEQRPFKDDTRLATRILRCSMKKKCTTKFVSANTNKKTLKKIQRHKLQKSASHSPDRSFRIRYTNQKKQALPCSTILLPYLACH